MSGPMSLAAFIAEFTTAVVAAEREQTRALERAALVVEREAKREIGTYQSAAGQFAEWPELAVRTKDDRVRKGFTENDPGWRTGEMGANINHVIALDGKAAAIGSNDDKLVWFELGTANQEPRSVLGIAAVNTREQVGRLVGEHVSAALVGKGVHNGSEGIY